MAILGIISRSEIMRSKLRNALRLLIGGGFALFLKKWLPQFSRVEFPWWRREEWFSCLLFIVFSESPPRREKCAHRVLGTSSGPLPSLPFISV